ncbi:MAG: hypothetical protein MJ219_00790 [Mycoplasmoidaceae bacterium]|nr:hypothetical protein [Mycoplasmoidaceae bacterium]
MFAVSLIKARYKKVSVKLVSVVDPTGADATGDFTILEESSSQAITSGQQLLYFRITVKDDAQEVYSNYGNYVAKVKFTIDKKDYVFNDFKIRVAKATDESDFQITTTSATKVVNGFNESVKAH